MKQKKILVLYSTAGLGHKKAAEAVFNAFREMLSGADSRVEMLDTLNMSGSLYKFLYLDAYIFLMSRARWLWGLLYYLSDNPVINALTRKVRAMIDYNSLPSLGRAISDRKPDAVISTHFILPSVASILRKKHGIKGRFYTLITDYGPHSFWISESVDRYFVGSDSAAAEMTSRGVSPGKISVTGIPVDREFSRLRDLQGIRGKYGLDPGKKTVFLMSGGFGVGPTEKILAGLSSCRSDIQAIVVCGRNEKALENVEKLKPGLGYTVRSFGFTDKVPELMSVSDLMITKAGGISTTEALVSGLPMILFASIPGQETWNEKLLASSGAAVKARKAADLPELVDRIILTEGEYEKMKEAIKRIRRPDAAEAVVKKVWEEIT
ncbi:MAG: glycosyltransferase [Candidatus Omnitrophica bacterium]|nr:glycosyltransferase [Candidatus Omnitrophota bacterium]